MALVKNSRSISVLYGLPQDDARRIDRDSNTCAVEIGEKQVVHGTGLSLGTAFDV